MNYLLQFTGRSFDSILNSFCFRIEIYYILAVIIFINCIRAIGRFILIEKNTCYNGYGIWFEWIISVICEFCLVNLFLIQDAVYFTFEYTGNTEFKHAGIISLASFIFLVIQFIFTIYTWNFAKDNDK